MFDDVKIVPSGLDPQSGIGGGPWLRGTKINKENQK